ncbi:MAG TPA: rod shape-determining protein MreD [Mycobacteriales bacterium]|nr:rod shape-determining protein MreD [Mycobacteriales bacterium]
MTARRIGYRVVIIIIAAILQVVVVNRLPLPGGHPDLVVLVIIAMALASGAQIGAILGFCGGFLADVLPPAAHIAGRLALAYTIVGYGAGLLEDPEETSVLTTILVVASGSAGAVLVYSGVGGLLGDARITASSTIHSLVATVVYDVVLSPFVVSPVSALARRLEPIRPRS